MIRWHNPATCLKNQIPGSQNTVKAEKVQKASNLHRCVKHTLFEAPQKAILNAYTSLCLPIFKYTDMVRDSSSKLTSHSIEIIQNKTVF